MASTTLTPTMRQALAEVTREPGQVAAHLPGGERTVQALMSRGLVEVQGEDWKTFAPEHRHEFKSRMHLDGCHYFRTDYVCDCGVQLMSYSERSMKADPWSAVWMDPEGAETGEACERCRQLMTGARPRHQTIIGRM